MGCRHRISDFSTYSHVSGIIWDVCQTNLNRFTVLWNEKRTHKVSRLALIGVSSTVTKSTMNGDSLQPSNSLPYHLLLIVSCNRTTPCVPAFYRKRNVPLVSSLTLKYISSWLPLCKGLHQYQPASWGLFHCPLIARLDISTSILPLSSATWYAVYISIRLLSMVRKRPARSSQ